LPGYLYFLWGLGKINILNIVPQEILYKLPAILADIATGYLIYRILSAQGGPTSGRREKWGLIGAGIFLFNPAVLANSALWGQVDSLTALTSVFSIYQFPISIFWSAISLSVGTLIKPQTAFIFPVIVFLFVKNKRKLSDLLLYCFTGLTVFILGFVPFWNHGNLISVYLRTSWGISWSISIYINKCF
jgi:dolichyl-phosphate-mannose-protein mannosyltransferase